MDLNEKLAARRRELAQQEEHQRIAAQEQIRAKQEAVHSAARLAARANDDPELAHIARQTPATKVVDIGEGLGLLEQAVESITKKQIAIFCAMAALSLIGLTRDMLMTLFWAVCALGYLGFTLHGYAKDIKQHQQEP